MLSVREISKDLASFAIKDVSFDVSTNQYFVLLGSTGVGKSLLLETIAGLLRPDSGRVLLDGTDITNEKMQKRKVALVFQSSTLFPHMTVYDNIAYPLRRRNINTKISRRVNELAEDFAVSHLLRAKPQTLSGGESQRVSLARAVASEPRCLLLDEPLSSLDTKSRSEMRALLRKIHRQGRHQIVHVTHDYTEAVSLATHVAVMEAGTIAQVGTVDEIFQHPKSDFVARFVGIKNFFKGRLQDSSDHDTNTRHFTSGSLSLSVLTDSPSGPGFVCVRSEDVTISKTASSTSARNNFEGTIVDIVPAGIGIEVIVNIGVEIAALLSGESARALKLGCGKKVWVSFKASAVKYVEE
ncbi:MAG: ATP-binding cassette domain-containing protein [Phycisphaerae bacterium]|nr:ABC transporter ATP-binding protein [Phycisphaerae bacterium]NIP53329.1 ABC transporter ATP-binding protein [Phycisphaerae bacterium]NIS49964.1 ABC transporter ATP-binding protein [Phycisphaerae bacterium]NIU07668.1 ABC transporter ATP-binding protein [Phycisphaerae bacterium]NIU57533.1 ATP-binding cassette domain-containing protein [Phycisphaerae bacterium]